MRTVELWKEKILPIKIKARFPIRIQEDLLRIPFPDLPEKTEGCFIYAPVGYGKTINAAFMLLQEEKRMYLEAIPGHCHFISTLDIFNEIKSTFDGSGEKTEQEIIKFYRECPFLVLDDFGTRKPTDWIYDILYLIINYRYEWMLPTIFTSNLNLNEIAKIYGDERLTSRIERMGKVLKLQKY